VAEVRLAAEKRTEFGKGGARRTRRAGKVPAVIYGHGGDPRHVSLPAHDFANAVRHGGNNVLLTLDLEDGEQLVIPKAIQRHPIKGYFEHVDLITVRRGEKITIDVPITVTGDVVPGGMVNQERTVLSVEAEATHLPSELVLDIAGREIGTHISAGDVALPSGSTLVTEADHLVLAIIEAPTAEELEAEVAEAVEELGIVEDQPEEPTEGEAPTQGDSTDGSADGGAPAAAEENAE
jgi:large subunit ribosomal protein L25